MDSPPSSGMVTFGQRLGARNVSGRANWAEESISSPTSGMCNFQLQYPHPKYKGERRVAVWMQFPDGHWETIAAAFFNGDCRQYKYEIEPKEILDVDPRIRSLVERYSSKLPTLDCLSQQRDYPLQSPWHSWLLLRPGDIEVVA